MTAQRKQSAKKADATDKKHRKRRRAVRAIDRLRVEEAPAIKRETFYALENFQKAHTIGHVVGFALMTLIVLNAILIFVSYQPGLDPIAATVVNAFYRFSTFCFFLEYIARIWIADLAYGKISPARARLKYIFSPLGIIDFLSFFPNMVSWFFPVTPVLRNIINLVRLVRLLKISRYMRGLRTIGRVLEKRRSEIIAAFLVIALLVVVTSILMYEIEHPAQPDKFNSLLTGVYFAVTTVTGTGYGDIVPITPLGRMVGSVIMFLSVALVAIPGGIFSAGFVSEYQNANLRKIERNVYDDDGHDDDDDDPDADGDYDPDDDPDYDDRYDGDPDDGATRKPRAKPAKQAGKTKAAKSTKAVNTTKTGKTATATKAGATKTAAAKTGSNGSAKRKG